MAAAVLRPTACLTLFLPLTSRLGQDKEITRGETLVVTIENGGIAQP